MAIVIRGIDVAKSDHCAKLAYRSSHTTHADAAPIASCFRKVNMLPSILSPIDRTAAVIDEDLGDLGAEIKGSLTR